MADDKQLKIKHGDSPAGGWGALKAGMKHVMKEKAIGRTMRSLLKVNQPEGYDCPGCAWPEPKDPAAFEFCENGLKAVAFETTGKRVTPAFFEKYSVSELRKKSNYWLEGQGRLTHPMRYNPETDHYEKVSWEDAFECIGEHLKNLSDPNEACFYTSGRTSNEAAFLYQLFGRMYGTNNFPDCSNLCHESSGTALGETIGIGKGTVTIHDFDKADAIFVIGQNPGTNHPRMLTELQKASERGCVIVSVNPLIEKGMKRFTHPQRFDQMLSGESTQMAHLYLQPVVGGDLALLTGMFKLMLEAEAERPGEVLDHAFIEKHTTGYAAVRDAVRKTGWDYIKAQSGLSKEKIEKAAEVYLNAERVIICWAMGLTQHKHSVPTIQMIVNLLIARGMIGKEGAGACPVRGHSNVQGDRTMGIVEKPAGALLERLKEVFGFEPPAEHGMDSVGAIQGMAEGKIKVFMGMGGNFAIATPDTPFTESALSQCDLTVHVSTKLNRSHVVTGNEALILPCLGRTEEDIQGGVVQKVTVEDSMSMVHASEGFLSPASKELRSEPAIVAGVAHATLGSAVFDWGGAVEDYDRIREYIAQVIPGFEDYNERLKQQGGFYLGNSARSHEWKTESGKAQFTVTPIPDMSLPEGQLKLMTMRSHDQYNTTIYGLNDRYRGVYNGRDVLFMNAEDVAERGLVEGDIVDITSHYEDGTREVSGFRVVTYDIPKGCAGGYFPELNPLVSVNSFADRSRTPTSKFVPITVVKNGS